MPRLNSSKLLFLVLLAPIECVAGDESAGEPLKPDSPTIAEVAEQTSTSNVDPQSAAKHNEAGHRSKTSPLPQAHAHNDYRHQNPLRDALQHGFCSVEADIFLVDGQLLVGHDRSELREHRTLQSLYLDPLSRRANRNGGRVYKDGPRFTLLVDIKSEGASTYVKLREVLAKFPQLCSSVDNERLTIRAIDVVISGNRPTRQIAATMPRRTFVDGRINELNAETSAQLVPLVSDNWSRFFLWRGEGPMPDSERTQLQDLVEQVHGQGRRLRFWATPDDPQIWKELHAAGVDLIGTDDLGALQRFLTESEARE
ncbi:MAG: phosphatidylinositol-specific phospholipase C/glycerophosphodiester phosphodiesterase family protein [Bythopirellula sp.]